MNAAAWGVIGALVGALASIATTWLTNRHAASLQHQQASRERMARHRDFQRETIIALQEAIPEYLHFVSRAHFEELRGLARGTAWGEMLLSDEVNYGCMVSARRTIILMERIANNELRSSLKEMHKKLGEVVMMHTKEGAEATLREATKLGLKALEELGVELRRQYEQP